MWPMCSVPDGYGSCSSTYDFGCTGSLETLNASSRSHVSCHFTSIACASYASNSSSRYEKASRKRGWGKLARRVPRCLLRYTRSCLFTPGIVLRGLERRAHTPAAAHAPGRAQRSRVCLGHVVPAGHDLAGRAHLRRAVVGACEPL